MARPPSANADATRRKILAAACELLVEGDSKSLGARAVARRAGVSPALIHHHFVDLDGLIDVVVETMYEGVHKISFELLAALGRGENIEALIERSVRELFRHGHANKPFTRLFLITVIRAGELDPARSEQTQTPALSAAASGLAKRLGLTELQVRMRVRSVVLLASRYAVFSDDELRRLIGSGSTDLHAAVEDHLVTVAKLMLMDGRRPEA